MAYQNVGTPRFYINVLEWENSLDAGEELPNVCRTLPVGDIDSFSGNKPVKSMTDNGFIAMLGHTIASSNGSYSVTNATLQNVVNQDVEYDGFSISTFENLLSNIGVSGSAGSIIIGTYYDMPHSPDLKLTMSREMDGVKRIRTKGGADLVNHKYTKPAMWGLLPAWELDTMAANPSNINWGKLSRSGRRVWDLSFSYLQDSDVFGSNQMLNNNWLAYGTSDYDNYDGDDITGGVFDYNLLTDDNFFSQVIHKTNGGQLPFIFQPDSSNKNQDSFAICKFDMKSFKFEQIASNMYNISLKIEEMW